MQPSPLAFPSPILGPFDHSRLYVVPLDITQDRIEMSILFDGK
jgi:hypothetical protein